jgi:choloylglycine hydrolase
LSTKRESLRLQSPENLSGTLKAACYGSSNRGVAPLALLGRLIPMEADTMSQGLVSSRLSRLGLSTVLSSSLVLASVAGALACTSMLLPAKDGGFIYGRTLEFGLDLKSQLIVVPRNITFTGTGPQGQVGQGGISWKAKYAATGASALGLPIIIDGFNEKGLAGGIFNFPGYAEFQTVPPGKEKQSLASFELLTYILTNFATVDEVRAGVPKIFVAGIKLPQFNNMVPPVHFSIHDASGKSIAIEYTNGGTLNIYDNPTHVMTNAPPFPFHMQNLAQYQYVTSAVLPPMKVGNTELAAPSSGDGMNGLPGGFLASARFVRAYFAQANAPKPDKSAETVGLAFHLMNAFDLPPGSIGTSATGGGEGGGVNGFETTEWTAVSDLKNLRYFIKTYGNSDLRMIDLGKTDLNAEAIKVIDLDQKQMVQDLTP